MIETTTFRLASGADESAFLEADRRVQTQFLYRQPGLVRRTTARAADGEWIVLVVWQSHGDADAAAAAGDRHPAVSAFSALIDPDSVRTGRYDTLD